MSKPDPNRHVPQDIDEYLAERAHDFQDPLEQLRTIIAAALEWIERVHTGFRRSPALRGHVEALTTLKHRLRVKCHSRTRGG